MCIDSWYLIPVWPGMPAVMPQPLFRGGQVSSSIFSVAKFLTGPLSVRGLRLLFDHIIIVARIGDCQPFFEIPTTEGNYFVERFLLSTL